MNHRNEYLKHPNRTSIGMDSNYYSKSGFTGNDSINKYELPLHLQGIFLQNIFIDENFSPLCHTGLCLKYLNTGLWGKRGI